MLTQNFRFQPCLLADRRYPSIHWAILTDENRVLDFFKKMAILTNMHGRFTGGVHPPENKNTKSLGIELMPVPKMLYIHFSQHTGRPARPLVKKGDLVKIGTKIGDVDGKISASVHSSISGKVVDITNYPHPGLGTSRCCVIEAADTQEWEEGIGEERNYENLTKEELINIIKEAGIVGLGGAAFPTWVKLSPTKPIDTLIINGCECEPMLSADHRLIVEYSKEIVEGARLFQKILGSKSLIFGIENNKRDAAAILKKAGMIVKTLKTKYPQGAEKQLIKAITNREVPTGGLPMDIGCVVQNVGTCYSAYQALRFYKPLIERVVTVTGNGVKNPKNLLVRIGTPALDVINFCGGEGKPQKLIFGGPMMGIAQYTDSVPVIKGTSGIIVLLDAEEPEEGTCVRCARCVDVCPMGLVPCEIYKFVKNKRFTQANEYGILDCIECGCCAYSCPAKIRLVHYLKYGKAEIMR